MAINIISYAIKNGKPTIEGALPYCVKTVDVRNKITNPWRVKELRKLNGKDAKVIEFIKRCKRTRPLVQWITGMAADYGYHFVIGCAGGKHRSVAIADMVAAKLRAKGIDVNVVHRDLEVSE